ncbi:hypothetical protein Trydic_g15549 [Trypoxylus dichotomus]
METLSYLRQLRGRLTCPKLLLRLCPWGILRNPLLAAAVVRVKPQREAHSGSSSPISTRDFETQANALRTALPMPLALHLRRHVPALEKSITKLAESFTQ